MKKLIFIMALCMLFAMLSSCAPEAAKNDETTKSESGSVEETVNETNDGADSSNASTDDSETDDNVSETVTDNQDYGGYQESEEVEFPIIPAQ